MEKAAIGFRAHMGWAVAVAITLDKGAPRLVHSSIIKTAENDDRIAKEPYHVAAGWDGLVRVAQHPNPKAVITEGRRTQARLAKRAIAAIADDLKQQKLKLACGAVLATRAWLGHDLDDILGAHAHVHVYEGEAVRDAIRGALGANAIKWRNLDEKSLYDVGATTFKLGEAPLKAALNALRGDASGPWRQDQKLAALAAWLALTSV